MSTATMEADLPARESDVSAAEPDFFSPDNLERGEAILDKLRHCLAEADFLHHNNTIPASTRVEFAPELRFRIRPIEPVAVQINGEDQEPTIEEFTLVHTAGRLGLSYEGQVQLHIVGSSPADTTCGREDIKTFILNPLAGHVVAAWRTDSEPHYDPPSQLKLSTGYPERQVTPGLLPIVFKIS